MRVSKLMDEMESVLDLSDASLRDSDSLACRYTSAKRVPVFDFQQ